MANETVSKTTGPSGAAPAEREKRNTVTNWRVFEESGLIPVRVKCDGYRNNHPADLSCHSNLVPTCENIERHMDERHGGGWFKVRFRLSDSKSSPLWRELESAGVELGDFYCPHCRESVPVSPRKIIYHLNPHPGANRVNLLPATLCMTFTKQKPEQDEYSDLYME